MKIEVTPKIIVVPAGTITSEINAFCVLVDYFISYKTKNGDRDEYISFIYKPTLEVMIYNTKGLGKTMTMKKIKEYLSDKFQVKAELETLFTKNIEKIIDENVTSEDGTLVANLVDDINEHSKFTIDLSKEEIEVLKKWKKK